MAEQDELAQWFVVQTLSGQEFKVQQSIERRRELEDVEDVVHEVVVPTEKVSEV
ncbi:MAG: transcription termination/antitermination protein NusG, partial [Lentisphaerae bacterium]|nr:transcription termination/antitermination protein NusG [Lentisphaerota bacterium]